MEAKRRCDVCGFQAVKVYVMSACEHKLCQDCVKKISSKTAKCPVCSKFGEVKAANNIPLLDRHTFVKCPNGDPFSYRAGAPRCEWTGPSSDVHLHVTRDCPLTSVKCWYAKNGCTFSGQRWQMQAHEEQCEFRPVKCEHCGEEQPFIFLSEHEAHCPENRVLCPNGCDKHMLIKLGELEKHLLICPAARPSCDICSLCQATSVKTEGMERYNARTHLEADHEGHLMMLKRSILDGEHPLKEAMLEELENLIEELQSLDNEIVKREERVAELNERLSTSPQSRSSRAPSKLIDVTMLKVKTQNELVKAYIQSATAQLKEKDARIAELKAQLKQ